MTSAEVAQEIFHRFSRSPHAAEGAELAQATLDLFSPVLPITHGVVARLPALARHDPTHSARA